MAYLYASNIDPLDRRTQLEIQLDSGDSALLRMGHFYDLTAGELQRARRYIVLDASSTGADEDPIGIVYLPIRGNPTEGQVPVWNANEGVFAPGAGGGGGGGGTPVTEPIPARIVNSGNLGSTETLALAGDADVWLRGTLNANCVVTVTGMVAGGRFILDLAQDATGSHSLSVSDGVTTTELNIPTQPSTAVLVLGYSWNGTDITFDVAAFGGSGVGGGGGAENAHARVVNAGNLGTTELLTLGGDPDVWLRGVLNANCVLTVTGLSAGGRFVLDLAQDSVGGRTLTVSDGTTSALLTTPTGANDAVLIVGYSWDGVDITFDIVGIAGGGSGGSGSSINTSLLKAVAVHNGTSYPSRPNGFGSVEWIGPTDPGGAAQNFDTWVQTA
jgi:hypothetical protein